MKIGGVDISHENGSKSWRPATFGILGVFIPSNNQRGFNICVSPINALVNKVVFTQTLIFPKFRLNIGEISVCKKEQIGKQLGQGKNDYIDSGSFSVLFTAPQLKHFLSSNRYSSS